MTGMDPVADVDECRWCRTDMELFNGEWAAKDTLRCPDAPEDDEDDGFGPHEVRPAPERARNGETP